MSSKKNNNKHGITRRDFIKWSAAAGAAGKALDWAVVGPKPALAGTNPVADYTTTNICHYCAVGCGHKIDVKNNALLDMYGDDEHPVNRGALCSKGAAQYQLETSPERIGPTNSAVGVAPHDVTVYGDGHTTRVNADGPLVRVGNEDHWHRVRWDDIIGQSQLGGSPMDFTVGGHTVPTIAQRLRDICGARETTEMATPLDRSSLDPDLMKVSFRGSAEINNEECWLYRKMVCLWGNQNIEHHARR